MVRVFGKRFRLFRPRSIWIRKLVQWFFFLLIALISVNHTLAESGAGISFLSNASLHAVCPFGGVETLYTFLASGLLVKKFMTPRWFLRGSFCFCPFCLVLSFADGSVRWEPFRNGLVNWGRNSSDGDITILSRHDSILSCAICAMEFWLGCCMSQPRAAR